MDADDMKVLKRITAQVPKTIDAIVCVPATLLWLREKFPAGGTTLAHPLYGVRILEAADEPAAIAIAATLAADGRRAKLLLEEKDGPVQSEPSQKKPE